MTPPCRTPDLRLRAYCLPFSPLEIRRKETSLHEDKLGSTYYLLDHNRNMNIFKVPFYVIFVLVLSGQFHARSAEPWEDAAIKGITSMNRGDGKTFTETAHTEFKKLMRNFMINRMRATPTSDATQKALRDYGISSLDELERLSLDEFVRLTIPLMHLANPPAMQKAMKEAEFNVVSSELHEGNYQVKVEMKFTLRERTGKTTMLLLVKNEGKQWKYYGDSDSVELYKK